MDNKFVKTVTKTVTTKTVVDIKDADGPECIYMSVSPSRSGGIDLVIGAAWQNRCASALSKEGLKELIDILTEIHEALED